MTRSEFYDNVKSNSKISNAAKSNKKCKGKPFYFLCPEFEFLKPGHPNNAFISFSGK